ncbi:MAG: glycoside hydrolase family 68 protein [Nostocales cyanobacterium 94392]|nr:glycoside hydrolase family 68 protein [Nostocales cyanobacterium 94392]
MLPNYYCYLQSIPKAAQLADRFYQKFVNFQTFADPWLLKDDGGYRLFFLYSPDKGPWWWKTSEIHSAFSTDLKHWQVFKAILKPSSEGNWDSGRICAGCTYKEDGIYYLFYSGAGNGKDVMNEAIGLATSQDGVHWQRYSEKEFLKPNPDNPYYDTYKRDWFGEYYDHFQWRDPYILKDNQTEKYYMFMSGFMKHSDNSHYRGCIGLAMADKIIGPYQLLPPVSVPLIGKGLHFFSYEMERPQVIYKNGKYHLFFSTWKHAINPEWLEEVGNPDINDSCLYHYVANAITGPYQPISQIPIVQNSSKTGLYATNLALLPDSIDNYFVYGWRPTACDIHISTNYRVNWEPNSIKVMA